MHWSNGFKKTEFGEKFILKCDSETKDPDVKQNEIILRGFGIVSCDGN
jgi:hypothetical protein